MENGSTGFEVQAADPFNRKKVELNDFTMCYYELGSKNSQVIIFLHGITDSSSSWASTAPLLADEYHVYALDQRGHGDSESPDGGYSIFQFGEDVIEFMNFKNIKKAVIAGHSMGSAIAHQVASKYPDRVSELILIAGSPTSVRNAVLTGLYVNTIGKDDFKDPISMDFIKEWQLPPNSVEPEFLKAQLQQTAKVEAKVWKASFWGLITDDHTSFLSKIMVPTLIIWGDQDDIYPRADQDKMLELIPGAELKLYQGAGHNLQWEQGRNKEVAADIQAFLAK